MASDVRTSGVRAAPGTPGTHAARDRGAGNEDASVEDVVRRMRTRNPKADPQHSLPDVHPGRIPRHVAIIMDGNGRWAKQRGLPRAMGHKAGAEAVRGLIEECGRLGVEVVTLYSFSSENWKRPADEIAALMSLYTTYIEAELERLQRENIRFVQIGRRDGLSKEVLDAADRMMEATRRNTAGTLCLAVNYGARSEIVDAVRRIAERVKRGELEPGHIDDQTIHDHLYTAGLPDPDLLIRTAGEMRISNYLLWQISYAELYVTDVLWPDFGPQDLQAAIRDFAGRSRRFGGLSDSGHAK